MTLEEQLRDAAAKGLTHLTLYPTPSADNKTTYWNARATPSTGHQYVMAAHLDPIEAVRTVLEELPRAKKRAPNPNPNLYGSGVTAAVTDAPLSPNGELETWLPKTL